MSFEPLADEAGDDPLSAAVLPPLFGGAKVFAMSSMVSDEESSTQYPTCLISGFAVSFLLAGVCLPFVQQQCYYHGYPYPLTLSCIDLFFVVIVLTLYQCWQRYVWLREQRKNSNSGFSVSVFEESWVFGPGLRQKCWWLFLPAFCFAVVISLTNMGLLLVSVDVSVLLKGTQILWFCLLAYVVRGEKPSIYEGICVLIVGVGATFISFDAWKGDFSVAALLINLLPAICDACGVVLLRTACTKVRSSGFKLADDLDMGIVEITLIKLAMALGLILPAAVIVEGIFWSHMPTPASGVTPPSEDAFAALGALNGVGWTLVMGTVLVTLFYQSLIVALASYTDAIPISIIQSGKTIPQIFAYLVLPNSITHSAHSACSLNSCPPLHITGMVFIIVSTVSYGILHHYRKMEELAPPPESFAARHPFMKCPLQIKTPSLQVLPDHSVNNRNSLATNLL